MPTPSGNAFFFKVASSGVNATAYGGNIPEPVAMGVNVKNIDGNRVEIVATSGVKQYIIVEPGDYPTTATDADKRRGAVRSKF